ncbi:hypothetical protein BDV93DRAFT_30025 [Ceratobasidium sp. AG-I]|nr:hypothetical protein BDV93DRAFT_30025 [Ceratobasidium sp. AG-I]
MPRSSFAYGSQNALMGELDLHCIDWSDTSNPTMTHVATLELPFVHSIPPILAEHQNQLTPAHIAMTITCHSEPSFSSSRSAPYARGTSRIFEPVKYNQLLRVRVRLPQVESAFIPGVPGMNRLSGDTSVYVPYHTVFSAVEVGKKRESGVQRVHWEDWAPSVRWVHLEPEFWEGQPRATNGSRCMLTRHSMEHYTTNWQDPNKRHTYDVYLLDFNPMFLDELAHRDDEERINENGSGKWVYQPAEPDRFSPITSNVERRTWLAECGAEKASAPYAWSKFKHEYFDTVVAQLQNTKVMFDDEHSKLRGPRLLSIC